MKSAVKEMPSKIAVSDLLDCIGECVLLRRIEESDEVSRGGIIKPEIARRRSNRGEIVALGEGRLIEGHWVPLNLKVGDIVHFSKTAVGMDVAIGEEVYLKLHVKQLDFREKELLV